MRAAEFSPHVIPVVRSGPLRVTAYAAAGAPALPWAEIISRVRAGDGFSRSDGEAGRGAVFVFSGRNLGLAFDLVVRQYRHGGLLRGLLGDRFLSARRFQAELEIHLRARELGLPVPEPLGVIVVRQPAANRPGLRGYYVTRKLEGVRGLPEYLATASPDRRLALAVELGSALRRLHRDGIFYADLQVRNLLVDAADRLYLIDFDKSKRVSGPLSPSRRRANLYRFARSVEKYRVRGGRLGPREQSAFLQAYEPDPESYRALFAALGRGLGWRRLFYRLGWFVNRS